MTPEEFAVQVDQIIKDYEDDIEVKHGKLDELMGTVLTELGYTEGIKQIANTSLWYA